jgi:hypothetical protein
MNLETFREPAAAGKPVSRTQASPLNIAGQRARDLQEGRKCRVAVDFDHGFPGSSGHDDLFYRPKRTGLSKIRIMALDAWTGSGNLHEGHLCAATGGSVARAEADCSN